MFKSLLLIETPEMIQAEVEKHLTNFRFKVGCFKSCEEVYVKPLLDSNKNTVPDPMIIIKNQNPFNDDICNYYVVHRYYSPIHLYLNVLKQLEDVMSEEEVTDEIPDCEPVFMGIRECTPKRTNASSMRMFEVMWETPDMFAECSESPCVVKQNPTK